MNTIKGKILPLRDIVLVSDMDFGEQTTSSGIVITADDGKAHGIKPRWAKVWAVGPEQKDVIVGDWICIEHGRWTRGFKVDTENGEITLRRVDKDAILLTSEERPSDVTLSPTKS